MCTEYYMQCPISTPSVSSFSLPLQADVGNDDGALLPGMTVIARISAGERENVAAVPLAALDNIRGQDVLYTAGDPKTGKLSAPAAVELGISDGDYAELLGGLEEGTAFYYYPYD